MDGQANFEKMVWKYQLKFFLLYLLLVSSVLMERSCILEINQVLNLRIRPDFDLAKRIRKIVIEVTNIRQ